MPEKLPVKDEDFIKSYNEDSNIAYFLEGDVQYPVNYICLTMINQFYQTLETVKKV